MEFFGLGTLETFDALQNQTFPSFKSQFAKSFHLPNCPHTAQVFSSLKVGNQKIVAGNYHKRSRFDWLKYKTQITNKKNQIIEETRFGQALLFFSVQIGFKLCKLAAIIPAKINNQLHPVFGVKTFLMEFNDSYFTTLEFIEINKIQGLGDKK